MSVQAGGYNSYHEMKIMSMPTIFIPNQNTGMDDQLDVKLQRMKGGVL